MKSQMPKVFTVLILLMVFSIGLRAQTTVYNDSADYVKDWQQKMSKKYQRDMHLGKIMTFTGVGTFVGGLGMVVGGVYGMFKTDASKAGYIATAMVGFPITVAGGVLMGVGNSHLRWARYYKKEAKEKGVQLTYAPLISPVNNTYGISLAMRF